MIQEIKKILSELKIIKNAYVLANVPCEYIDLKIASCEYMLDKFSVI